MQSAENSVWHITNTISVCISAVIFIIQTFKSLIAPSVVDASETWSPFPFASIFSWFLSIPQCWSFLEGYKWASFLWIQRPFICPHFSGCAGFETVPSYPFHIHVHLLDFMSLHFLLFFFWALLLFPFYYFIHLLSFCSFPPPSPLLSSEEWIGLQVQPSAVFLTSSSFFSEVGFCSVLQSCVSSGLWNFSSCTLHKPPKTHCGQNWIYRWFCLQTDLVSLVFPHFCQRYWGIMISYQSLGIRILQCTSFVPSTNAVCRVSEFMPIYYNDSFQSMRHVHNWHHMQPVYGNMMDQRKNFRSKEKSWAWEQSISSESEEWKVCHILLFHS